jgi:hypothetical protein
VIDTSGNWEFAEALNFPEHRLNSDIHMTRVSLALEQPFFFSRARTRSLRINS